MFDYIWSYDPVTPADVAIETADSAEQSTENIKEASANVGKTAVAVTAIGGITVLGLFVLSKVLK